MDVWWYIRIRYIVQTISIIRRNYAQIFTNMITYIATALLLSFDYHLRVYERFDASHLITDNSTKLERSIESIIRII